MRPGAETLPFSLRFRVTPVESSTGRVSTYLCSEGELQLFIGGRNLCELDEEPPRHHGHSRHALHDHLFPYVQWLTENFNGFFEKDPFPLKIAAKTAAEFERASLALLRKQKTTGAIEKVSEARADWLGRHGLATATDGGFPPNVFFRRDGHAVEVSWDSSRVKPYQGERRYKHQTGSARLDLRVFHLTLEDFILRFLSDLLARHPGLRADAGLQKVLKLADKFVSTPKS